MAMWLFCLDIYLNNWILLQPHKKLGMYVKSQEVFGARLCLLALFMPLLLRTSGYLQRYKG